MFFKMLFDLEMPICMIEMKKYRSYGSLNKVKHKFHGTQYNAIVSFWHRYFYSPLLWMLYLIIRYLYKWQKYNKVSTKIKRVLNLYIVMYIKGAGESFVFS